MASQKKKNSSLHKYVIFTLTALCIFTIAMIVVFVVTGGNEPSTLIACFFAAFGGELFSCAMIKKLKLKSEDKNNE